MSQVSSVFDMKEPMSSSIQGFYDDCFDDRPAQIVTCPLEGLRWGRTVEAAEDVS